MTVLVMGGTGKVGRPLVDQLLSAGHAVRVLSRRPRANGLPAGVEVVAGSPDDGASVAAALAGADRAFVVLVGDVAAQARGVAEGVRAAGGLGRAVLLSSSAVQHPVAHRIGDEHRQAEQVLAEVMAELTVLRPGPFHSNALWWAASVRATRSVRCSIGNQPGAPVDPADVAAVASVALTTDGHAGRQYALTGPEVLTSQDQTQVLSQILGHKLAFEVASEQETVDAFARISGDRDVATGNVRALRSPLVPWRTTTPVVGELLGCPAVPFRAWAAANADLFR